MCSWLLVGEKSLMMSLVAADQSQNVSLKLVWVIPNEQEVLRTYARHQNGQLGLLSWCKGNVAVRLHTINYKTSALVRVCNDVNSEIAGLICKSCKGLMLR